MKIWNLTNTICTNLKHGEYLCDHIILDSSVFIYILKIRMLKLSKTTWDGEIQKLHLYLLKKIVCLSHCGLPNSTAKASTFHIEVVYALSFGTRCYACSNIVQVWDNVLKKKSPIPNKKILNHDILHKEKTEPIT